MGNSRTEGNDAGGIEQKETKITKMGRPTFIGWLKTSILATAGTSVSKSM
jgi:hypothetical protein